jgi:uncharacterized membrane protein
MYILIFVLVVIVAAAIVLAVFPNFDPTLKRYFLAVVGILVLVCLLVFLWQTFGGTIPSGPTIRITK